MAPTTTTATKKVVTKTDPSPVVATHDPESVAPANNEDKKFFNKVLKLFHKLKMLKGLVSFSFYTRHL